MKPSIGRIVHYHAGSEADPQAAIITNVHDDGTVSLHVFAAAGDHKRPNLDLSSIPEWEDGSHPGGETWCWPPRVE